MNKLSVFLKGLIIGGTMTVPGVSGGSMAMILGIYERLISSISSFFKQVKENLTFLSIFLVGSFLGMFLFANSLLNLMETYPMPVRYFFVGAVAGGIPMIYREARVKKFTWHVVFYPVIGILVVWLISSLPTGLFSSQSSGGVLGILLQGLGGFIVAIALILPGISVSQMLLMLGLYEEVMTAISTLKVISILPLGLGIVAGILLTTKFLESAMRRYPQATYLIVLGFILGALLELFPGFAFSDIQVISLITAFIGFMVVYMISSKEEKSEINVSKCIK